METAGPSVEEVVEVDNSLPPQAKRLKLSTTVIINKNNSTNSTNNCTENVIRISELLVEAEKLADRISRFKRRKQGTIRMESGGTVEGSEVHRPDVETPAVPLTADDAEIRRTANEQPMEIDNIQVIDLSKDDSTKNDESMTIEQNSIDDISYGMYNVQIVPKESINKKQRKRIPKRSNEELEKDEKIVELREGRKIKRIYSVETDVERWKWFQSLVSR